MRYLHTTRSREDLIDFGLALGEAFKRHIKSDGNPWLVTINGTMSSGKSLIALAVDQAFRPEEYPNGITSKYSADDLRPSANMPVPLPVGFDNFMGASYPIREEFDDQLRQFIAEREGSKVLLASNLRRSATTAFNYAAKGLSSDFMDMNIIVTEDIGFFRRNLMITIENELLIETLKTSTPGLIAK